MKNETTRRPKEWRILIQDWVTPAHVGILPEEMTAPQDIRVTIYCDVRALQPLDAPSVEGVVCYDQLLKSTQRLLEKQHYYLLETLSEAIVSLCLQDKRVHKVFVRLEKMMSPQQKFCFGVELTRCREDNL